MRWHGRFCSTPTITTRLHEFSNAHGCTQSRLDPHHLLSGISVVPGPTFFKPRQPVYVFGDCGQLGSYVPPHGDRDLYPVEAPHPDCHHGRLSLSDWPGGRVAAEALLGTWQPDRWP